VGTTCASHTEELFCLIERKNFDRIVPSNNQINIQAILWSDWQARLSFLGIWTLQRSTRCMVPDKKSGTPFCDFTNRCHIDGKNHKAVTDLNRKNFFNLLYSFIFQQSLIKICRLGILKFYGELPESLFYAFIAQNMIIFSVRLNLN